MQETVIWAELAAITGLSALVIAILKWVASIARQLTLAETAAKTAEAVSGGAMGKCELLGTDFHNHRVTTAAQIASIGAMADNAMKSIMQAEARLAKSMDDLGERMERAMKDFGERMENIVDRIDRVLEPRLGGRPRE